MPGEIDDPIQIGQVAALKGQAFADFGSGVRPLSVGAPVHQGETIITKAGANSELPRSKLRSIKGIRPRTDSSNQE